jgi:hypothetical protein
MEALAAGFWGMVGDASLLVGAFVGLYSALGRTRRARVGFLL